MKCFSSVALVSLFYANFFVECVNFEPLILTPLLESGRYNDAQAMARVVPDILGVKSYSGYFTVNQTCGNNLFFWFMPAEKNWETAPVVLWLNGGPGCSSMIGLFEEIGPFHYVKKLRKRNMYWSRNYNIIFLDQPAGVGYSFTTKNCYATDLKTVSQETYRALVQFFMLFPNIMKNNFFIIGESWAGHYIPALASEIDKENLHAKFKINMVGFMIGNACLDDSCPQSTPYFYQLGIIDDKGFDILTKLEDTLTADFARRERNKVIDAENYYYGNLSTYTDTIPNMYNVMSDASGLSFFDLYIRRYETRKMIHVGKTQYNTCNGKVNENLLVDVFGSAREDLEKLLQSKKYTVGFYTGQLDAVCMYTSLTCVLRQLNWPGAADYLAANRSQWYVGERLAGWYKTADNLFEVVVRDSGHFVPTDQPEAALDLLKAFVADKPGTKLLTKLRTEKPT